MSCNCKDCEYKEEAFILKAQMASHAEQFEAILERIEQKVKKQQKGKS